MAREAGDDCRGGPRICHSEDRRGAGELSLSFEAALVLTMSLVGSCLSYSLVGTLEVEVDRRGRDLGSLRLPLQLAAAHLLFGEQLTVGCFDPVASTLLIYGLFA